MALGHTNTTWAPGNATLSRLKQGLVLEQQNQREPSDVKRPWLGDVLFPIGDDSLPRKGSHRSSLGRLCSDSELWVDHKKHPLPTHSPDVLPERINEN